MKAGGVGMPFYEYECSSCKFYLEVMQKISESPLRKCPSCGKNTLKKLVSAPAFRLKGEGWYETDFKSDKEARRNLAVESKPAETPSGDTAKAETAKAETASAAAK
ncbi:MAG: FmdB family zinc ribbon protein, partial [Steroidobacteraceae bacterium]